MVARPKHGRVPRFAYVRRREASDDDSLHLLEKDDILKVRDDCGKIEEGMNIYFSAAGTKVTPNEGKVLRLAGYHGIAVDVISDVRENSREVMEAVRDLACAAFTQAPPLELDDDELI